MSSKEAPISMRARAATLRLVSAAVIFAATRISAQELHEDPLASLGRQIEQIQSSQGINSPELVSALTTVGLLLREQGDVDLAVAAFERARHVVRVNYGLSSFKEAPLLRQLVQIEEAKGNAAAAWEHEQELLRLIRRYPGPAAAPMLREIADKRVDVLEEYMAGRFPPQIELGCYYAGPPRRDGLERLEGNCRSGTKWSVKQALYEEARLHYVDTIEMILLSEGGAAEEIPDLYLSAVRAMYAARNDFNTEYQGRGTLRAIHSRLVEYSKPLPRQMRALVDIADWDLLFARGRKESEAAFQAYERLYEQLRQQGLQQSFIDQVFSPSMPVVLPEFSPNPLAPTGAAGSSGHIDVAFDITRHGQGESIEILATTTNHTEAARLRLKDLIRRSRFRPRMANGTFEDPARVVVRYYVDD